MTKKEKTIKACRELADKYRNPIGEIFFIRYYCPLCGIHSYGLSCKGCPLANGERWDAGCFEFNSFNNAYELRLYLKELYFPIEETTPELLEAFEKRAKFFDKIIPILEKIPAERFTKNGWKYFDELDRKW